MPLSRSGGIADSGRLLQPASPRFGRAAPRRRAARASSTGNQQFPRLGQCPAGGHAALQDGVGGRATVMDSEIFPDMLPNLGISRPKASRPTPDIRLFALIRAIVSPWKGVSEPSVVRYGKISIIFFDSITVSEETGRCGRASPRDRPLAQAPCRSECAAIRCGPGEPPIDAPAARASQGGRPVLAVEPGERRDRAAGAGCLPCEKAESEN